MRYVSTVLTAVQPDAEMAGKMVSGVEHAIVQAFGVPECEVSVYLLPLAEADVCCGTKEQTTVFVWTTPGKTASQKRELLKLVNENIVGVTGYRGKIKVVTIIKQHEENNIAVNGCLLCDA